MYDDNLDHPVQLPNLDNSEPFRPNARAYDDAITVILTLAAIIAITVAPAVIFAAWKVLL